MEKENLKGLFLKLKDAMHQVDLQKTMVSLCKNNITRIHQQKTLTLHENHAKYISDKIDKFGSGFDLVQVTGDRMCKIPFSNGMMVKESFAYFLYGVTQQEAELIMKAQVIKYNLIEDSLKYRTIEIRKYITIT